MFSSSSLFFLHLPLRHGKRVVPLIAWMDARKHRLSHNIEPLEKMVPFVASECAYGQHVCQLASSVDIFDLDLRIEVDPVKQPTKRNSVGSGYVSHCWTSALNDHLDHNFIVFKHVQLRLTLRTVCVCGDVVHMRQLINISGSLSFGTGFVSARTVSCCGLVGGLVLFDERNTSITTSLKI